MNVQKVIYFYAMPTSLTYLHSMLQHPNVMAAIKTIRWCEGTDAPDGYFYLFGSRKDNNIRFVDTSRHPNIKKVYTDQSGRKIYTTAAGILQFTYPRWTALSRKYGIQDFSPRSQEVGGVADFDDLNVLHKIRDGQFFDPKVMDILNNEWASLPGAGYHQPERSIAKVMEQYRAHGGETIA